LILLVLVVVLFGVLFSGIAPEEEREDEVKQAEEGKK
jgi:Na+-transporting methylmalonyl-CoA/oxaloacetate decarboxylase gamma subunit